jgi:uncharacterized protein
MTWKSGRVAAVKLGIGPAIMLKSGSWFDFCSPASSDFTIEDIAHGLANICRYAGQCKKFYSVAEHSILVSEIAVGFEFEALLHDAAEAFIGDITRPLKQLLPEYKKIESSVQRAVLGRFGVPGYVRVTTIMRRTRRGEMPASARQPEAVVSRDVTYG